MSTISHSKFLEITLTQTRKRRQAQTRDGHYVFEGGGQFPKKKLYTAKTAEKNRGSAFCV